MSAARVTSEQIVDAYKHTGSVWRAAKLLGVAGQTVHRRLVALQYPLATKQWDDDELTELRDLITAGVRLGEIAQRLGRGYHGVACKASEMRIKSTGYQKKKIPRGAGFDKVTTLRHMNALETYAGKFTQYARANSLSIELLVRALEHHCHDRWTAYVAQRSDLPHKACAYCAQSFIPASAKQQYCSRKCGSDARIDASYFGGKRKTTVGLAEGVCQLCGRQGQRGLSSHHVLGKENDPDNEILVALCSGCHNIVTILATRTFVDDPTSWESLISLAWMRKHGPELSGDRSTVLEVAVDIDSYPATDDDAVEGTA